MYAYALSDVQLYSFHQLYPWQHGRTYANELDISKTVYGCAGDLLDCQWHLCDSFEYGISKVTIPSGFPRVPVSWINHLLDITYYTGYD